MSELGHQLSMKIGLFKVYLEDKRGVTTKAERSEGDQVNLPTELEEEHHEVSAKRQRTEMQQKLN